MLMAITAWPCCTPMLLTCPTGTPAMLTVSPPARPVTSASSAFTVWRLLKSEMLPIRTASPTSSTMQTSAKSANLNAERGKWRQNLTTTDPRGAG